MKIKKKDGRHFEMEIDLPAPVEKVWECLSKGSEYGKWFAPSATIEPGKGGSIVAEWPNGFQTRAAILGWEEKRYLSTSWSEMTDLEDTETGQVVEYVLEERGDSTRLRLIHSGFGEGDEWDAFYDGVSRGWSYELRSLRHYLTHHQGRQRSFLLLCRQTDSTRQQTWERLSTVFPLSELESLGAGQDYRLVTGSGDVLSGQLLALQAPTDFVGTVSEYNNALCRLQVDLPAPPFSTQTMIFMTLSAYDVPQKSLDGLQKRWDAALSEVFAPV